MIDNRPFDFGQSSHTLPEVASRWAPKIIALSAVLIAIATLYPFKFVFTGSSPLQEIVANFTSKSSWMDVLANIVLFTPLGFGFASAIAKRKIHPITKLLAILCLCFCLSLTIELLQVFLPGRQATPLDVVSNTLGGGVGFFMFQGGAGLLYRVLTVVTALGQRVLSKISVRDLVLALAAYVFLASTMVVFWQGASLNGWNPTMPLMVGNHFSQHNDQRQLVDMSWRGTVADLVIRDRALSTAEVAHYFANPQLGQDSSVLAAYSLKGQVGLQDQTGQSPNLVWRGEVPTNALTNGAMVSESRWLQTEPAPVINQRLKNSSQFTLSATITPTAAKTAPQFFQPILSLADSPFFSNLSLMQMDSSLGIFVNVSKTGRGASLNQQAIPNFFTDNQPHAIVATYSAFVLRVYLDNAEQVYRLDLTPTRYQIMLYVTILVPLAFLIGLLAHRLRRNLTLYLMLLAGGTVLPSLLIESFLANQGDRPLRGTSLLLGMLIVGGTLFVSLGTTRSNAPRKLATRSS